MHAHIFSRTGSSPGRLCRQQLGVQERSLCGVRQSAISKALGTVHCWPRRKNLGRKSTRAYEGFTAGAVIWCARCAYVRARNRCARWNVFGMSIFGSMNVKGRGNKHRSIGNRTDGLFLSKISAILSRVQFDMGWHLIFFLKEKSK
jgi:hypothetical protein